MNKHQQIVRNLIAELEARYGVEAAFPVTAPLTQAYDALAHLPSPRTREEAA